MVGSVVIKEPFAGKPGIKAVSGNGLNGRVIRFISFSGGREKEVLSITPEQLRAVGEKFLP